ncbi:MAG: hypothetical protein WBN32_01355 [Woeseia sp.]
MLKKFFLELRRREVFRTAGLYIGIAWITIEVASVLWPAFEWPEQILQWLVLLAVAGFPVALVLAWIFDISDGGIVVQGDATETAVLPVGGYKMDFVVIAVLSVALLVSLYLNVTNEQVVTADATPLTVFVEEIDNRTGNSTLDGVLTRAILRSFAVSPNLNLQNNLDRSFLQADAGAAPGSSGASLKLLPTDATVLVSGSVEANGPRLVLNLRAVDQASGDALFEESTQVNDPNALPAALSELAEELRAELGDTGAPAPGSAGTLSPTASMASDGAVSLAALKAYDSAERAMAASNVDAALQAYVKATELDAQFAAAWAGAAFAAYNAGRKDEALAYWQKADALKQGMNPRERLQTYSRYYAIFNGDYAKAIDSLEQLLTNYPADGAALAELAQLLGGVGQHVRAYARSTQLLQLYPDNADVRAQHLRYALYANDIETVRTLADALLTVTPQRYSPRLALAAVAMIDGDSGLAQQRYEQLATLDSGAASLAAAGLADIALFEERNEDALALLQAGIAKDGDAANDYGVATKRVALAQAHAAMGAPPEVERTLQAMPDSAYIAQLVPVAEIHVARGEVDSAQEIAARLRLQKTPAAQAYARMIDGMLAFSKGDYTTAINRYRDALRRADLWLVRWHIGQAYLKAGYPAEASDEFASCLGRRGEAAALFFDDVPTFRYTAGLDELRAAADKALSGSLATQ